MKLNLHLIERRLFGAMRRSFSRRPVTDRGAGRPIFLASFPLFP